MSLNSNSVTPDNGPLSAGSPAPEFERKPVFGLPVRVPDGAKTLVLLFIRHLGDPFARQTLAEVQDRYADFDRLGIKLVAITQTELVTAQDFVPRYHVLCPVITDPEGTLQAQYGIGRDGMLTGTLRGLIGTDLKRIKNALGQGHGRKAGSSRQLSAEFVIEPGGQLVYANYGQSITDGPDLDELLRIARAC